MKLKVKLLNEKAVLPSYQTSGASGFDFHSAQNAVLEPQETRLIETGLSFEIPQGYEIQVRPRSGLSLKTGLRVTNSPGTVDSDYTGEVKIIVQNTGKEQLKIAIGDRIAQGVLAPVLQAEFELASEIKETERGSGAFGSTGVKIEEAFAKVDALPDSMLGSEIMEVTKKQKKSSK